MRKDFLSSEDLWSCLTIDATTTDARAASANRFPVRFVLFDTFGDSAEFVDRLQNKLKCTVKSVSDWIDSDYPDTIITHSELSDRIKFFAAEHDESVILTPFSELARFYDNVSKEEFNSLIATIKGIENGRAASGHNRRIYIPIVGLEGKMARFDNDSQSTIWHLKSEEEKGDYKLILTNGDTFGVKDLSEYTLVNTVYDWLEIWKKQPDNKSIILTSPALFANEEYARPDNAFMIYPCHNAYEFLTRGLSLDFGSIVYRESDEENWKRLGAEIDANNFSFEKFFNSYFHIDNLADYGVFLKAWFDCEGDNFKRWLLASYYDSKFCQQGYVCLALQETKSLNTIDFFTAILSVIFESSDSEKYIEERAICLEEAAKRGVKIGDDARADLKSDLEVMAQIKDYQTAIRYFSPLTKEEKELALEWLSKGYICKDDIKSFLPSLYDYLERSNMNTTHGLCTELLWLNGYFDAYKMAKCRNQYAANVESIVREKNATEQSFKSWYGELRNTKTHLYDRQDIDVYYWIDGLGVDWIPYIIARLEKVEGVYLNEVLVACAAYPSKTDNNKKSLVELAKGELKKYGDLDEFAHSNKSYPHYILDELDLVDKAIEKITSECHGKKVAIVSDHGITYLSQYCDGLNMVGVNSDHGGRVAERKDGRKISGDNYVVCEDEKTFCALRHASLCAKIHEGLGAHGGCTPEEVLVPIFIISPNKQDVHWTAKLLTGDLTPKNSVVRYEIKGLLSSVSASVLYNGKSYGLQSIAENEFESEPLSLDASILEVKLVIDGIEKVDKIKVNMGATEVDLFDF
ncbi:MAG: BREX-4 system phosphatase PglZ [Bacteroides sp.]|nr:BREX-4 system phosphatase PglZ [Ruminococcus flavefaciens]MCM1554663.1 BREX-4 system phosphatase PglZ [Bacteroides sp.]